MTQKPVWRSGYIVVFVLFMALLIAYLDRVNMAILIADSNFLKDMGIADRPDLRGLLMSVFLWTYGCAALLLSFALDKVGARRGLVFLALVCSISMFFGGIAWSFMVLILSRIILGIGEGIQLPLNSMVVKNWAPPRERGIANSIWGSGLVVGSAITMPLVAAIIASLGWRASFFILGITTIAVTIPLVLIFVYNHPKDSPWVKKDELDYIEKGLAVENSIQKNDINGATAHSKSEWSNVLKNADYWLVVAW